MKQLSVFFAIAFFAFSALAPNVATANTHPPHVQFPGGNQALQDYIKANVRYPSDAREEGVQGDVKVSFYVNSDGSVSRVKILKGLSSSCDMAVFKVFQNMPN